MISKTSPSSQSVSPSQGLFWHRLSNCAIRFSPQVVCKSGEEGPGWSRGGEKDSIPITYKGLFFMLTLVKVLSGRGPRELKLP